MAHHKASGAAGETVTSHDVARAAGVSQPTVSRALRGLPGIAPKTVEHVRSVAESLGYVVSEAGRTLSTQRTRCIGIVAVELTNPFYPELVEPIRAELEEQSYRTLLVPDSPAAPLQLQRLADGTLDGVILTTLTIDSDLPALLRERGIPSVLTNRTVPDPLADSCAFDNANGARLAAGHLLAAGHREIAVVSGSMNTSTGREREEAFLAVLAESGLPVRPKWIMQGPFAFDSGYRAALSLCAGPDAPTAVFCGNDVIALGVSDALVHLSRPDIAVVGFDDIAPAGWDVFSLTTVHCDLSAMAHESVRLLLARIENPERAAEQVRLPVSLVVRRSTERPLTSAIPTQGRGASQLPR